MLLKTQYDDGEYPRMLLKTKAVSCFLGMCLKTQEIVASKRPIRECYRKQKWLAQYARMYMKIKEMDCVKPS
jgi:hypothetical protein